MRRKRLERGALSWYNAGGVAMALNVQGAYRTNKGGVSAEVLIGDAWEPVDFDRAGNPEWAMIDLAAFQGIRVVDNNLPDNLIEFRSTDGSRVIVHEIE